MLDTFKELTAKQLEAALGTVDACVDRCPQAAWDAPVGNHAFCQVAFHGLFWADLYLGLDLDALRVQPFHRDHQDFFRDYEELEDRAPRLLYDRSSIKTYLEFCRAKTREVIAAETTESLQALSEFDWLPFSRAEVYTYNIRHVQHHAAQLSLRLRIDVDENIPWIKSGWRIPEP